MADDSLPSNTEQLTPIRFDSTRLSSLVLELYPKNSELFINGIKIQPDSKFLSKLNPGIYHIEAFHNNKSVKKYEVLLPDAVLKDEIDIERKTVFYFEPAFMNFTVKTHHCIGPAIELGLKCKNVFYGINYLFGFGTFLSDQDVFGGSFIYSYEFNYKFLYFDPGASIGYWVIDGESIWEHFFGGPSIKLRIGFDHVTCTTNYNLLFGTSVGHIFSFAVTFIM